MAVQHGKPDPLPPHTPPRPAPVPAPAPPHTPSQAAAPGPPSAPRPATRIAPWPAPPKRPLPAPAEPAPAPQARVPVLAPTPAVDAPEPASLCCSARSNASVAPPTDWYNATTRMQGKVQGMPAVSYREPGTCLSSCGRPRAPALSRESSAGLSNLAPSIPNTKEEDEPAPEAPRELPAATNDPPRTASSMPGTPIGIGWSC
jgi:hypothetical protein